MQLTVLDEVVASLAVWKGHWVAIAAQSGVPYDTVTKIAQGKTRNPRVQTVLKLHGYLQKLGDPPKVAA